MRPSNLSSVAKQISSVNTAQMGMLVNTPRRNYKLQRMHVYDGGGRNSISGINATVFGATSVLGMSIGSLLTSIGSTVVYPYRSQGTLWEWKFKEIKPTADLGYKAYVKLRDMTNEADIKHVIRDQNTVISCIGSHIYYKKEKEFEDANINVPRAIAKVAAANPNVKRLIHISAAGADPNSQSMRLRTKWIGEQEVKEAFPDVTILRPTMMMDNIDPNRNIASKWGIQMKMFNRMNFVVEGMNAEVQPVFTNDVALAIFNAIKTEESIGKSYDLGGPHTYNFEELYEQFFSLTEIKPYSVQVKLEEVYKYYQYPWFTSPYRKLFRPWLNPEFMTIEAQNLVVNPQNLGFKDLSITPVSFGHKAHELVNEVTWMYGSRDVSKRDTMNS